MSDLRDDGAPTVDKITAAIALAVRCMSVSVTTAPERAVLQRLAAQLSSLIADSAAAPCSTLPDEDELFQRVEAAIRLAAELGIDSVYDFVHGRGMKLYRERIRDEIAALRSQLSSCETELKQARVENATLIQAMIDVRARLGQMLTDSQSTIRTHIAP